MNKYRDSKVCYEFGDKYPIFFPEIPIIRNMHAFIFHVPRFVRLHKSIGLLSEEEGEGIHNAINKELRQLHSVENVS